MPVATSVAVAVFGVSATTGVSAASPRIIVGVVGDAQGLSQKTGIHLPYHGYGKLNGPVPKAPFVNMKPAGYRWSQIAQATPGSAAYTNIARWADALKERQGPLLFAFHHEPESREGNAYGNAAEYIAAYRRVVDIFRERGVNNVQHTWQMTSWAFEASESSHQHAKKWYPGDGYVDYVGTDPYNWYDCGPGRGKWEELKKVMDPTLAFARKHGKRVVVAEFGSQFDPSQPDRRAQWLRNAQGYFNANRATIHAVFYFQFSDPGHPDCKWLLHRDAEIDALGDMARAEVGNSNAGTPTATPTAQPTPTEPTPSAQPTRRGKPTRPSSVPTTLPNCGGHKPAA